MQRNFVLDMTNFSTNLVLNEPRETRTSGDSQLKCAVRLRSTLACPRPRPRRQSKPPYSVLGTTIYFCLASPLVSTMSFL